MNDAVVPVPVRGGDPGSPVRPPARPPDPEPPRERKVGLTPVSLLLTLLLAYVLYQVQLLLILVLMAVVFATVIEHPVQVLERRKMPRPVGILLVYVTIIGGLALLFTLLAPVIRDQAEIFRAQAPDQLRQLQLAWATSPNALLNGPGQDLLGRTIEAIADPHLSGIPFPGDAAIGVVTGVGGALVSALSVFVITFYYLMEKTWLRRLIVYELPPDTRARVSRIWDSVEGKVGDWLRGQLLLCLTIGMLATVGYGVLGIRFWPLLGLWAGLTEIIPILGPWLGGIPAFIIALTQGWEKAALVALFVAGLQLLENVFLVPRVMRGAVGLSPMTVFLAILAGTQWLGVAGALLAIPFAAAVQVVLAEVLAARKSAAQGAALPGWRWMRGPLNAAAPPPPTDPEPAPDRPAAPIRTGWSADLLARASALHGRKEPPST